MRRVEVMDLRDGKKATARGCKAIFEEVERGEAQPHGNVLLTVNQLRLASRPSPAMVRLASRAQICWSLERQ